MEYKSILPDAHQRYNVAMKCKPPSIKLLWHWLRILVLLIFLLPLLLARSAVDVNSHLERVRSFSRSFEFDFWNWTLDAVWVKFKHTALNIPAYLSVEDETAIVRQAAQLMAEMQTTEGLLVQIYADPTIENPDSIAKPYQDQYHAQKQVAEFLYPITEAILERQTSTILAQQHLTFFGQPIPPVFFRLTPLPKALIVSPREVIRQDVNLSLVPELELEDILSLEESVANALGVSTLVTNVGGVGTYPTMVAESSNLAWLVGVVNHEWTHNYLTLRPLGLNYDTTPELRTMNETTASIAEEELRTALLQQFYPDLLPPPQTDQPEEPSEIPIEPPIFDFAMEMYITRTQADHLLNAGQIDNAEAYMEERRLFFYENGYLIRRLNQAYFAFYSAYVNAPETGQTGAAGTDPVGPAVWALRSQYTDLSGFLNRISWMNSFEDLQTTLHLPTSSKP